MMFNSLYPPLYDIPWWLPWAIISSVAYLIGYTIELFFGSLRLGAFLGLVCLGLMSALTIDAPLWATLAIWMITLVLGLLWIFEPSLTRETKESISSHGEP